MNRTLAPLPPLLRAASWLPLVVGVAACQPMEEAEQVAVSSLTALDINFTTTGAYLNYKYPAPCQNVAPKVDIWRLDAAGNEFHGRCFLNSAQDPARPGLGYCPVKYPLSPGESATPWLVRVWRALPDRGCAYADAFADTRASGYDDTRLTGSVHSDLSYPLQGGDGVFIEKPDYSMRLSPEGTVYEFYSRRTRDNLLQSGHYENAIHAHDGAALQVALHSGAVGSLTANGCAGQGYWNPTQAGATCSVDANGQVGPHEGPVVEEEGLVLFCDGARNRNCSQANQSVHSTLHRMMSFDYGPQYPGPYNAADTSYIGQAVRAEDNYAQFDVELRNFGPTRDAAAEVPTLYLTQRYRRFTIKTRGRSPRTFDISQTPNGDERLAASFSANEAVEWISFENTGLSNAGPHHITLVPMLPTEFEDDVFEHHWSVEQGAYYHNIKFTYAPRMHYRQNKRYVFRYLLAPYSPNETLAGQNVGQLIASARSAYTPDSGGTYVPLEGAYDVQTAGAVHGWALDPNRPADPVEVEVLVDGQGAGRASANRPRADVNAVMKLIGDHGYVVPIDARFFDGRPHDLAIDILDSRGGRTRLANDRRILTR